MLALFLTRLGVYLLAVLTPLLHPAVAISYDRAGYLIWFVLVPLEMVAAYALRHTLARRNTAAPARPLLRPRAILGMAIVAIAGIVAFGTGLDSAAWSVIGAGVAAFALTSLVFSGREYGYALAGAETFFIGYIYLKMLRFSRASAAIADESSILTTVLMAIAIAGFVLHGIVLYQLAFGGRHSAVAVRRGRREFALFGAVALPVLLALAFLLPADFVENQIAFNGLNELPPRPPQPIDGTTDGEPGGNLQAERPEQGDGEGDGEGGGESGDTGDTGQNGPGLEGIPAAEWDQRVGQPGRPVQGDTPADAVGGAAGSGQGEQPGSTQGEGEGGQGEGEGEEGKQYAVMVIASARDPVYAADAYYGDFEREAGLTYTVDEPLNDLVYQRLLDTWESPPHGGDLQRRHHEYTFFSTQPRRPMPYRPAEIEPTIQRVRYHPFSFSYRVVSNVSDTDPDDWATARALNAQERQEMSRYLEVDLQGEQRHRFLEHAQSIAGDEGNYFRKIDLILRSFSTCQYEIGFTDDVSVSHVDDFLFETRSGDCTEFSNSAALLGRLLGIPSRVVTGWLGTSSLQTPQHVRGLQILRQSIEPLQDYALEDLFLITSAHRHSWTQFWIPGFGWVDFETTSHAQQPSAGGDANSFDIVIPIIEVEEVLEPRSFVFPWRFVLIVTGALAGVALVGAYGLRYGRQATLALRARRPDSGGIRAQARLLYMRMASNRMELKPRADTVLEYAVRYPQIAGFASLYTMLRYRDGYEPAERAAAWRRLRESYRVAGAQLRAPGLRGFFARVFSLRSLYY